MHSRIFQVSKSPVEKQDYYRDYRYFDDFVGSVADYVSDDTDRDEDIEWLAEYLSGVAEIEGDKITFKNIDAFFSKRYQQFCEAVIDLGTVSYQDFRSGISYKAWRLQNTIEDKFGFYMDSEKYGLEPIDSFLRSVENGDVYYIGATIDYHA